MSRGRIVGALVGLAALMLGACEARGPAEGERRRDPGPAQPTPTPSRAQEPQTGPRPDPAAYFLGNGIDEGPALVRLDEAGVHPIATALEHRASRLFVGPSGDVLVLDPHTLWRIEDEVLVTLERFGFDDVAPVDDLALSPSGEPWIVGGRGVGVRRDGAWSLSPLELRGARVLFLGPRPWLVGRDRAALFVEGSWRELDLTPLGPRPQLRHLAALAGQPGIVASDGRQLFELSETGARVRPLPQPSDEAPLRFGADLDSNGEALVLVASGACELLRFDPRAPDPAAAWRFGPDSSPTYAANCRGLESVALDDRRRAWVLAREGLSVIEDGGRVHAYPAGRFVELVGRRSHMLVVGQGPALPPADPSATIARASLAAELRVGGGTNPTPAAAVPFELCPTPTPQPDPRRSPCADAQLRVTGETDGRGRIRVDDVPLGDYGVAIDWQGRWRYTVPPSFAARMRAGQVLDLGQVRLPGA